MSRYPDKSRHPERSHWVDKKDKNPNILSLGRLCYTFPSSNLQCLPPDDPRVLCANTGIRLLANHSLRFEKLGSGYCEETRTEKIRWARGFHLFWSTNGLHNIAKSGTKVLVSQYGTICKPFAIDCLPQLKTKPMFNSYGKRFTVFEALQPAAWLKPLDSSLFALSCALVSKPIQGMLGEPIIADLISNRINVMMMINQSLNWVALEGQWRPPKAQRSELSLRRQSLSPAKSVREVASTCRFICNGKDKKRNSALTYLRLLVGRNPQIQRL